MHAPFSIERHIKQNTAATSNKPAQQGGCPRINDAFCRLMSYCSTERKRPYMSDLFGLTGLKINASSFYKQFFTIQYTLDSPQPRLVNVDIRCNSNATPN